MPISFQGCVISSGVSVIPEPADPYWSYVSYLMSTTAVNAQQNSTFIDSSTNNFTVTRFGNTTQSSNNPFSPYWSNYFDGSGDYLSAPTNAAYNLSNSDFTIEAWVYMTVLPSTNSGGLKVGDIIACGNVSGNAGYEFAVDMTNNRFTVGSPGAGGGATYVNYTFSLNTWYHLAFSRSSGTNRMFVNGVSQPLALNLFFNYSPGSNPLRVGAGLMYPGYEHYFPGFIADARIIKGTGIYTSNFTPNFTPLTAVTGTSVLTCQNNRFVDNSSVAATMTPTGDTRVSTYTPYILPSPGYSVAASGGSGYFDGNGDYLQLPSSSQFSIATSTTPFTIEGWIYPIAAGGVIFSESYTGAGNSVAITVTMSNGSADTPTGQYIAIGYYNGASWTTAAKASTQVPLGAWTHIACVFTGFTVKIYYNGVDVTSAGAVSTWGVTGTNGDAWYVGRRWDTSSNVYYTGYITSFRFVNGIALYPANFTPPTAPLTAVANTSLLLNFANAGAYDATTINSIETVGNAQVNTTTTKFGVSSMYFDGSGDYLNVPYVTYNFDWSVADYTLEYWFYANNLTNVSYVDGGVTQSTLIGNRSPTSNVNYWSFGPISNGTVSFYYYTGVTNTVTSTATITANTWNHIAMTKTSSGITIFVNGVAGTTTAISGTPQSSSLYYLIIGQGNNVSFNGYIEGLRITKGYARYVGNFNVPTTAFPVF